jgi:hypothetical protein
VNYTHDETDPDTAANFYHAYAARQVTINLAATQDRDSFNEHYLRGLAFHEVTESMLIGRLRYLARERYITEGEIDEVCHDIVNNLQAVIFEEEYKKDRERERKNGKK